MFGGTKIKTCKLICFPIVVAFFNSDVCIDRWIPENLCFAGGGPGYFNLFDRVGLSYSDMLCQRIGSKTCTRIYFAVNRSEEHTSELQSQFHLVCRLLLEK